MKRSRLFLALGVAGVGIVSIISLTAKPPAGSIVPPTATPPVIIKAPTATTIVPTAPLEPTLVPTTLNLAPSSTFPPSPIVPAQETATSPTFPASTPTLIAPEPTSTPQPATLIEATLARVIDGDTIDISIAGSTKRVRLIGVDSPETNGPPICYGQEATTHAQGLLPEVGGKVWLEKDLSETDRYGRLLRYVWLEPNRQRMLDEQMVADGYAQVSTFPPDVKYQERFLSAERIARAEQRGLWGTCEYFGAPLPTSTSVPPPTTPPTPIAAFSSTPQTTSPTQAPTPIPSDELPYDPHSPDRDCPDFATHDEAQRFFLAAGGPENDPHRLDGDHDGIACETLP